MGIVIAVLFGPLVWAAHFAFLYGSHASICAAAGRSDGSLGPLVPVIALTSGLALLLVSLPLAFPRRFVALFLADRYEREKPFLLVLMRWLAGLSVAAVLANGIAVLMVPPC